MTERTTQDSTGWITPAEAAAALGVSTKSVGRLADRGIIRAIRTDGNHRRFASADVEAILARAADWRPAS